MWKSYASVARIVLALALSLAGLAACTTDGDPATRATRAAPMPLGRTEVAGAAWDGDIAVVGGLVAGGTASDRADLYRPRANRWEALPPLPVALHHTAVAALDRLYVVGGFTFEGANWKESPRVFSLSRGADAWREEPPMPAARGAHAVVALGNNLIVAGGVVSGRPSATTAVFAADTGWRDGPLLGRAREHLAAAVADGRAFVIAGRADGENFTDVESWDGAADAWRREPSLNDSRGGIGAATVDGQLCVAGGEEAAGTIASVECLDGEAWRRVTRLRVPRHGLAVVAIGRDLHVIGGGPRPGLTVSRVHEVLDVGQ